MSVAKPDEARRLAQLREVIVGRNSRVWRAVASDARIATRFTTVIGHAEMQAFPFGDRDRVWIFSYSRRPQENSRLLATVAAAGVAQIVYVSSATTVVNSITRCYEYPRIKLLAESQARGLENARILILGLVVRGVGELPPGSNAATLQSGIAEFMLAPHWPHDDGKSMRLFEIVQVPFKRPWEARLHAVYDATQTALRGWPCALRPLDLALRIAGIRWYGYVNLSNRLWTTTTSLSARD